MQLTQFGEILLPYANAILRLFADSRQSVQAVLAGHKTRLTVGVIPTIMPYLIAGRIPSFLQLHPEVDLRLVEENTASLLVKLRAGEIDLAVLSLPVEATRLISGKLFREQVLMAVPTNHRMAGLEEIHLRELRSERLVLLREGHCFRDRALTAFHKAGVTPLAIVESGQFASILALVGAGAGISLVPEMAAIRVDSCRFLPIQPAQFRTIGYVRRPDWALTPAEGFLRWLKGLPAAQRPRKARARSSSSALFKSDTSQ